MLNRIKDLSARYNTACQELEKIDTQIELSLDKFEQTVIEKEAELEQKRAILAQINSMKLNNSPQKKQQQIGKVVEPENYPFTTSDDLPVRKIFSEKKLQDSNVLSKQPKQQVCYQQEIDRLDGLDDLFSIKKLAVVYYLRDEYRGQDSNILNLWQDNDFIESLKLDNKNPTSRRTSRIVKQAIQQYTKLIYQ